MPSEKQYGHNVTDVPRDNDSGYLRRGVTLHKCMLNTKKKKKKKKKKSELKDERSHMVAI